MIKVHDKKGKAFSYLRHLKKILIQKRLANLFSITSKLDKKGLYMPYHISVKSHTLDKQFYCLIRAVINIKPDLIKFRKYLQAIRNKEELMKLCKMLKMHYASV